MHHRYFRAPLLATNRDVLRHMAEDIPLLASSRDVLRHMAEDDPHRMGWMVSG